MNRSIITELESHIRNLVDDEVLTLDNRDEWHFHAFNEDYYIIGYYQASEWLKKHDSDAWEAIGYVMEQQEVHFGESALKAEEINSERIVNLVAYFAGFEALDNIQDELVDQLEGNA